MEEQVLTVESAIEYGLVDDVLEILQGFDFASEFPYTVKDKYTVTLDEVEYRVYITSDELDVDLYVPVEYLGITKRFLEHAQQLLKDDDQDYMVEEP